ncbi:MAG: hypothetical protein BV459_01820 [Thermoplasmata archaeon M11B2D]|nr:MAG: hypothetical protein BV459_01820 [Thermoplasmata archaeon M11B2D]
MSATEYSFPGDFVIKKLELKSFTGQIVDIRYMLIEFNIYEDLFNNTLSGDIVIEDSLNLIKYLPIVGQETITIEYSTAGKNKLEDTVSLTFDCYKISKRARSTERSQTYAIHFVSHELTESTRTKVSKAYNKPSSDIAKDLFTNHLKSKKTIFIEPSKYTDQVVFPMWEPLFCMNWLCKRSVSASGIGSDYVFFESVKGFYFVSIESLVGQPDSGETKSFIYKPSNTRDQENVGQRDPMSEFRAVEEFTVEDSFDTIGSTTNGMYASKLITHDIVSKKIETTEYNYLDEYENHNHIEKNKIKIGQGITATVSGAIDANGNRISDYSNSYIEFYPKHKQIHDSAQALEHVGQWFLPRISRLNQIESVKLSIVVVGDSSLKVGDVIHFYVPSYEEQTTDKKFDTYITGRYLITAIRHQITPTAYKMVMEISKDCLSVPLPKAGEFSDALATS